MLKKDLVFEIGTEEIPAKFMNKSLEQLKSIAENKFKENRIGYGKINVFGTPRRLTLYAVSYTHLDVYKRQTIYCEKESHKRIIIGKGGNMLKAIGSKARVDIENLLNCRVNLQLWVKIKRDWRNSLTALKDLGYR